MSCVLEPSGQGTRTGRGGSGRGGRGTDLCIELGLRKAQELGVSDTVSQKLDEAAVLRERTLRHVRTARHRVIVRVQSHDRTADRTQRAEADRTGSIANARAVGGSTRVAAVRRVLNCPIGTDGGYDGQMEAADARHHRTQNTTATSAPPSSARPHDHHMQRAPHRMTTVRQPSNGHERGVRWGDERGREAAPARHVRVEVL
jgi:hypothetical protein